ncbi:outer membrane beta-barrel family protein [Chitinophaga pinensis]|uniref:TonB-dependent receptor plug n=1 Tax=Chitinophaga pinensis (strain ATCC 43595 / DSM 2588 / LMG 13176 / NBRC 15968 / NCIMB 11800 / UQM 2034) TaxID=485918 RepID=A0A979G663_CHIPD|nr:outer membrane beta-barrel family protein [Chitinophaga pinensis]ACU61546.1 TonB-dependent receptor plug [Chitinophaga pinensis DSM 2588]
MKRLCLYLLSCCLGPSAIAQISGSFVNTGGQPIPFANVLLLNGTDTTLVKAALTDEKGLYSIASPPAGKYLLRFTGMGFQIWHSPLFDISATRKSQSFGQITIHELSHQLGEVVIQAEKPLFQPQLEGMVVNVQSSLLTKGSSALSILERSPGVMIDYRNNSIALNGKNGVMVMLNGKLIRIPMEQLVHLLNGMSADDIEKIELLTSPSSKYDAEGSAGLINIVLKKDKQQGTNGTLSLTGGYGYGEKATAGIHLSHNTGKLSSYGSYTYSRNRTYSDIYILSYQDMPVFGGRMEVLGYDTTRHLQHNHDASLGIDLKANAKTSLGASVSYNGSRAAVTDYNYGRYLLYPDSVLTYNGQINRETQWRNLVSSVYVERTMKHDARLNFTADYLYFKNDNPSQVQSSFITSHGKQVDSNDSLFAPSQRGMANTVIQVGVLKADYSRQLNRKLKLEAGLKGTYTVSNSTSRIESLIDGKWIGRTETINDMRMRESIGAAYISANLQLAPSLSLTAGTRYEYTRTKMTNERTGERTVDRTLSALFPNLAFSKKLNDHTELQLSYTKRISRPSYNDLAAFVGYSDPTAVYTGNQFLQPSITHNIKLGYNYKSYSFSLLFSRDDNPIARYQLTQSPAANLLYVSPQNLAYQHNITLQATLPWKVNDWWDMSYNLIGGYRQFRADYPLVPVIKSYFGYSGNFTESFRLPQNFGLELTGWYNGNSYNGTIKVGPMGTLSAGIKKELKNNGGTLQLSVADLLKTMTINVYYGTLTDEAFYIKNHVKINTESSRSPVFKLSYSRSFGMGSVRQTRQQEGAKDERDRIRKD